MALLATSSALPGLFHMLTLLLSSLVLSFLVCSIQASSSIGMWDCLHAELGQLDGECRNRFPARLPQDRSRAA